MTRALIVMTLLAVVAVVASAEPFQKFTFRDAYLITKEVGPNQPDSVFRTYFAQLDSLGITLTHTQADNFASNNCYGVKLMGQYNMRKFPVKGWLVWDLRDIEACAHNVYAEAETAACRRAGRFYRSCSAAGCHWRGTCLPIAT